MFLLFSRPPEFFGIPAFFFILTGFVVISVVSGLLLLISLHSESAPASKGEQIKSWLAGSTVLGAIFLIANLILAIPMLILLFFVQVFVVDAAFGSSDRTFHRFDNFFTVLGIAVNLICFIWAVKVYRRKIYDRFFERRET